MNGRGELRRTRATEHNTSWTWSLRQPDLDVAAAGFVIVIDGLADDEARGPWGKAHAGLRLARILKMLRWDQDAGEWVAMQGEEAGAGRDTDRSMRIGDQVERVLPQWSSSPRGGVSRLERIASPQLSDARADWTPMRAELGVAKQACAWP